MNPVLPDTFEEWSARIHYEEIGLLDLLFLEELIRQESSGRDRERSE